MNNLFSISLNDYFEVVNKAKANGKKPGDSMTEEFYQVMKERGIKPLGATELTFDELLKEQASHRKKVIGLEHDKDGKTIIKKVEPEND
jgi:hypothetical protein